MYPFAEMEPGGGCRVHFLWSLYVHVSLNPVQLGGLFSRHDSISASWNEMDLGAGRHAEE